VKNLFSKTLLIIALIAACGAANAQDVKKGKPIAVIFDTDMGPDYDDVGTIALLHYYADRKQATILATMASTRYPRVAAVLSVLNTYFKRPDIPIGVSMNDASDLSDSQKWSDTLVAKYPHKIKTNAGALDAVKLYRRLLAKQPDHSVTLITVGFFNNIANLLKSPADEYSKLSGQQLVDKKVLRMVSMAGKYPSGTEFNMDEQTASTRYVFEHFTRPVIFSGFEIGEKIKTGLPLIHNKMIKNSPVKDVFRICIPLSKDDANGRMSWDETAVLVAINGAKPYFNVQPGKVVINDNGSNSWATSGNQAYLTFAQPAINVQAVINKLIMHQPAK
jgi:pyrimidine-specific ribonucleoside hydrolase